MKGRSLGLFFGLAAVSILITGCPQGLITVTEDFELDDSLGGFSVEAGVPEQNSGVVTIGGDFPTLGSGTMAIEPGNIGVVVPDNGSGKAIVRGQSGDNVLTIRASIAAAADVETVCDDGEEYGPFEVTLDENNVPVSVSPSSVTLSDDTMALLNGGEFSICLEVVSPIDAEVTIESLTFVLGL